MRPIKLTTQEFKDKIFDYSIEQEWKYKGSLPAVIDFYADWCGPCRMMAPVLETLAVHYADRLAIYKVDTEAEQELTSVFGIQSLPTFLFIPLNGDPMMQPGALPRQAFQQIIDEKLLPGQESRG